MDTREGDIMSQKNEKMGALWVNEKDGNKYLTGELEIDRGTFKALEAAFMTSDTAKVKIVVFQNGYKEEDRHPDWIMYKSKPKGKPEEITETEPF
jgi:hypothetical protein